MLEAITNKGNGTHYYIDTLQEARRVFLQKLMGTLVTIAKDVKIQIEFNRSQIKQYRLLGYANRMLRKEDFSNDKIDAGDLGAGHTVTAFYEVETGDASLTPPAEKLRYGTPQPADPAPAAPTASANSEWLTVKLRYKQPEGDRSTFLETPYTGTPHALAEADSDFRFGAAVAMTGLLLRGTEGTAASSFGDVRTLAAAAIGTDPHGLRAEFVRLAEQLAARPNTRTLGR
jgi:Ca-activated chloride channel family protein